MVNAPRAWRIGGCVALSMYVMVNATHHPRPKGCVALAGRQRPATHCGPSRRGHAEVAPSMLPFAGVANPHGRPLARAATGP